MNTLPPDPDVTSLVSVAEHCAARGQYQAAIEALLLAQQLVGHDAGLEQELKRLRRLAASAPPPAAGRNAARESQKRRVIDANQYIGLADLLMERGDFDRGLACLQAAKALEIESADSWKTEAKIREQLGQGAAAAEAYAKARRLDPFDLETAEQHGILEYQQHRYPEALRASVDAYLLTSGRDEDTSERLRRRMRTLRKILGWSTQQVVETFRLRQEELQTAFDRLEWRREQTHDEASAEEIFNAPQAPPVRRSGQLALAQRLRSFNRLSHFSDEQLFLLTRVAREELYARGAPLLEQGTASTDLYLIESGEVGVRRTTPYGQFPLATVGAGELLGEVNFIGRDQRSAEVHATKPTRIVRLSGPGLDRLANESPDVGVHLYWTLWHSLARRLRSTNEQLKDFLPPDSKRQRAARRREGFSEVERMDVGEKIRLFRDGGISSDEIRGLAAFAQERRYPGGTFLFHEGDEGNEMFVVADGRVRISKFIPGGGEEALAILERGDFFGEMALVDGHPRSADARAHGGPLTVLALSQAAVHEILGMDPRVSIDFLRLLCRLMAKRLREIDEKVTTWRIIASQAASESA
jgi:CRP/FNR family cyclic AMP-dependent transcriptional regulator